MLSKFSRSISPRMLVSFQTPPKLQTQKLDMSVCMLAALNLHLIKRRQHPPTHISSFRSSPLQSVPRILPTLTLLAQGILQPGPSALPQPLLCICMTLLPASFLGSALQILPRYNPFSFSNTVSSWSLLSRVQLLAWESDACGWVLIAGGGEGDAGPPSLFPPSTSTVMCKKPPGAE